MMVAEAERPLEPEEHVAFVLSLAEEVAQVPLVALTYEATNSAALVLKSFPEFDGEQGKAHVVDFSPLSDWVTIPTTGSVIPAPAATQILGDAVCDSRHMLAPGSAGSPKHPYGSRSSSAPPAPGHAIARWEASGTSRDNRHTYIWSSHLAAQDEGGRTSGR